MGKIFKWVGIVVVALVIIGAVSSHGSKNSAGDSTSDTSSTVTTSNAGKSASDASDSQPAGPSYTAAQENAIQAAQNYLNLGTGFSRAGLIGQLSSKAGSGFSRASAVFAVNHIKVDWKKQAVTAAKNYMNLGTGFSRSGLIQQLSSKAGSKFTVAQATYAANQVGL